MQFIKRPFVLLYKGYKSSVNYDGEPSVSNGIVYQLPSSHLLIHRVPAKLSNRVIALRSELLQATALVCILILLTCSFHRVRLFRGRIPCFIFCWSSCLCRKCFLLFLPFNVRKHLFRIIRSFLGFFDAKPLHICLKRTLQCTKKSPKHTLNMFRTLLLSSF